MEKEMFAIVQWTQGKDKGRYTVGYPISYIKNFNYELYENDEYELDQPFPVEWHEPGKKPVGGWEVFEAIVIQVSSSIKKLEKMMNIIDAKEGKKQTALLPMAKHMVPGTEDANVSRKRKISEIELDDKNESSEISNVELLTGPTLTDGKEKNEYVTKADLKAFAADIIHFFNKNESSKKPKHLEATEESVDCFEKATKSSNKKSQIKILTAGENKIEIPYDQWKDAKSKLTFTAMGWALVRASFEEKVLLESNYKGGSSKNKSNKENFKKLNETTLHVIRENVRQRFEKSFNYAQFGSYINTRLSQVRTQFRKQKDSQTEDNTEPTAEK